MAVWPDSEAPRTIVADITPGQSVSYQLPAGVAIALEAVVATVNAAAGSTPELTIAAPGGAVITAKPQATAIPAGDTAFATWALRLDDDEAAGPTPAAARCRLLGSGSASGNSLTCTLTDAVPAAGVLRVVWCGTSASHLDTGWSNTATSDSQGVAGWTVSTVTLPQIGYIRQTTLVPDRSTQAGDTFRACTAGDLGAGDTISLTFDSAFPASFRVVGLIVWQDAYNVLVKQKGLTVYGNGDSYPDFAISDHELSWVNDFSPTSVQPDLDALIVTAMGASPGQTGFVPLQGSLVGELAIADVSVAVGCIEAAKDSNPDPGGTWPAAADHLVGNYQTVLPHAFT